MGLISYSSGLRHTIVQELQDGLSEEQDLRDFVIQYRTFSLWYQTMLQQSLHYACAVGKLVIWVGLITPSVTKDTRWPPSGKIKI